MEENMSTLTRVMRWAIVPSFAVVVTLAATGAGASAQDMAGQDMMGNGMAGQTTMGSDMMNTTMVMVPMGSDGTQMMSVTVRMPMEMGMMMDQPTVRQIPGVGYEIDYGGPSILIERSSQN
jgi:hypothetical protein